MTIADIITAFGAYYIKNDANKARLFKLLNRDSTTDTVLTPFFTDDTIYRAGRATIGRVLQPFQKAWTPLGTAVFTPIAIELFKMKVDSQEYPDDLEGTWLGFLAGDSIDRKEWPFIRWFIEVLLLPQAKEDYEMNEVYKGVFAAPTPGTPGASSTAMNGIRKAINTGVTAGRITPLVLGALPAGDTALVTYVEAFVDAIDKRYAHIQMQLCCSQTIERAYRRAKRKVYGKDIDFDGTNVIIEETNITLIGLPSMVGSTKLWCTPKGNALHLKKKTQNMNNVEIESVDRLVKMFTDWWSGVGFVIPELVWTNDVDLA